MLVRIFIAALAGVLYWLGVSEFILNSIPEDYHPFAFSAAATLLIAAMDLEWIVDLCPERTKPFMRVMCGVRSPESRGAVPPGGVTLVAPAHEEEDGIEATVRSIQKQTVKAADIIVIDDGSTDQTNALARKAGATVYYRERKADGTTQGKAAAQIFGLSLIETEYVNFIDGDTVLKEDALEQMMPYFNEAGVSAVGGYVLPHDVDTIWGKLRQFQYHYGAVIKLGQNNTGSIFVSSGCFTSFKTSVLRKAMRLQSRRLYRKNHPAAPTGLRKAWYGLRAFLKIPKVHVEHKIGLAEDQLYTWLLMEMGRMVRKRIKRGRANQELLGEIRFAPQSICLVHDPKSRKVYTKQGYRWNAGYFQNLKEYRFNLFPMGFWFALFTYFNLIYSIVGTTLEAGAIGFGGYLVFQNFEPTFASWLAFVAHLHLWPIINAVLTFYMYEFAIVASVIASFMLGLVLGMGWMFLFVWIPVMKKALTLRADGRLWLTAWAVFPFMVFHYLDVYIFYSAFLDEILLGKRLNRWDKGHAGNQQPSLSPVSGASQDSVPLPA
jgi:cellulose synthase/poly-beta-1,6-N-acetylglucosamine synthase-like glycosyltransferase